MARLQLLQNFVGGSRQSDRHSVNMSYTQNMFTETQGEGASASKILRSIPGMRLEAVIQGTPRGSFVASRGYQGNERLFVAFGDSVYAVDRNGVDGYSVNFAFGIRNGSDPVTFTETGGEGDADPCIVCADGANVFVMPSNRAPADFASNIHYPQLPKNAKGDVIKPSHVCYAYNYLLVNDTDSDAFYMSEQYPFEGQTEGGETNWDCFTYSTIDGTTNEYGFVTYAEWCPDNITAIISTGSNVWTFGPRSFQIFQYNNSVNFPFTSPNTAAQSVGILAPYTLCRIGETVLWLGSSDVGHFGVYRANGTTPERISNPDVERTFAKVDNIESARAQAWVENGHAFYAIDAGDSTYVFDLSENEWHNRVSTTKGRNENNAWRYSFAVRFGGKIVFLTKGAMCTETEDSFREHDGAPIIRIRRGGAILNNFTPFYLDAVKFVLSNGYAEGDDFNPSVMFRYSTDDVRFWNERIGYMGRRGQYDYETVFLKLGLARTFNFELSCSDNVPFDIISCVITYAPCGRF